MVDFDISKEDGELIRKIVRRAMAMAKIIGWPLNPLGLSMDITATHAGGCPLRLQALLDADDFDFQHDLIGIFTHVDRDTGKLGNMFRPRFAVRTPVPTETV